MNGQAQPYQPLTSENAALVLVDHQVGLMTGVRDYSTGELKHNVIALTKAAKALKLPIVVTTTARDSMWGPTFPELVEALPGIQIIDRSTVNAWDDPKVAAAIEATGRKKLIIAGISLEVCVFSRYKVRSAILRSENTRGIRPEDRIAMLHQAESIALSGIRRFPADKYAYVVYCQVGSKLLEATGDNSALATAITKTRAATEHILDPDLERRVSQFEDELRQSSRKRL
jgi:hypothetical protein